MDIEDQIANIAVKRTATSMQQCSEWRMGAVQSSFPQLKDTMIYEEHGERIVIFNCMFHLYNLRARLVGIDKITYEYLPALDNDANVQIVNF